jgi:hypothetical protein
MLSLCVDEVHVVVNNKKILSAAKENSFMEN